MEGVQILGVLLVGRLTDRLFGTLIQMGLASVCGGSGVVVEMGWGCTAAQIYAWVGFAAASMLENLHQQAQTAGQNQWHP